MRMQALWKLTTVALAWALLGTQPHFGFAPALSMTVWSASNQVCPIWAVVQMTRSHPSARALGWEGLQELVELHRGPAPEPEQAAAAKFIEAAPCGTETPAPVPAAGSGASPR